jgi:hypothetical protein
MTSILLIGIQLKLTIEKFNDVNGEKHIDPTGLVPQSMQHKQ